MPVPLVPAAAGVGAVAAETAIGMGIAIGPVGWVVLSVVATGVIVGGIYIANQKADSFSGEDQDSVCPDCTDPAEAKAAPLPAPLAAQSMSSPESEEPVPDEISAEFPEIAPKGSKARKRISKETGPGEGGPAVEITRPDGTKIDINKGRVKEQEPNPFVPGGMRNKRFPKSPGLKDHKRLPTDRELQILDKLTRK